MDKNEQGELIFFGQHRNLLFGRGHWQEIYSDDGLRYVMGGLAQARSLLWAERDCVNERLVVVVSEEEVLREFDHDYTRFRVFRLTDKGEDERAALLRGERTVLPR